MSVIYVLLTISIVVAVFFFIIFIHSVRSGQYEDSYTPSVRILFEDELLKPEDPAPNSSQQSRKTNTKSKQF
jgi:cbb3-type cytochrome oxidase maturation protein